MASQETCKQDPRRARSHTEDMQGGWDKPYGWSTAWPASFSPEPGLLFHPRCKRLRGLLLSCWYRAVRGKNPLWVDIFLFSRLCSYTCKVYLLIKCWVLTAYPVHSGEKVDKSLYSHGDLNMLCWFVCNAFLTKKNCHALELSLFLVFFPSALSF